MKESRVPSASSRSIRAGALWLTVVVSAALVMQASVLEEPANAYPPADVQNGPESTSVGQTHLIEPVTPLEDGDLSSSSTPPSDSAEGPDLLGTNGIDTSSKSAVIDAFRWDYMWVVDDIVGSSPGTFGWTGSVAGCDPGTISASAFERTEVAVNFFRSMAGLRSVIFEPAWSEQLQAAALIMAANWDLSHDPDSSWVCWTETGAEGAARSNIALGPTSPRRAIELYMSDPGESNTPVGHRRWILSPGAESFGFGATSSTNALRVLPGNPVPPGTPEWIPYPASGYWPAEVSTARWSLSYGQGFADFSNASVSMTYEGAPMEIVTYVESAMFGGISTIVWDVVDDRFWGIASGGGDERFELVVTGIKLGDTTVDYTYTVTIVDALPPVPGDAYGNEFLQDIVYLQWKDITKGCNPPDNTMFCPDADVTRGQMAAFLTRALNLTVQLDNPFSDDDDSIFEDAIERLAAAGITKGCNPPNNDRFCPDEKVTRGQMAAFLVRALGYTDNGGGNLFIDDDGSVYEGDIDRLGTVGVTKGCNPPLNDRFCPKSYVTRGQMAAFLHRALG